jgi:hypothetical protein
MEYSLVKQSHFNLQNIDPNNYLLSLLDAAQRAELISEGALQNVELQITEVLRDLIIRYSSGESSSVPVEIAENLLQSILFCMDTVCAEIKTPAACLDELLRRSMKDIYEEGLALVRSKVYDAKKLYREVKTTRVCTSLVAYNTTIDETIPGFFKTYDTAFNAHDTTASIDYPLAGGDIDARGVLYILQYLERLKMENLFCKRFNEKDINQLLDNYGRVYRIDYPEFLINIFEVVLTNSVFSVMLGTGAHNLAIQKGRISRLRERLAGLDTSVITVTYKSALDKVIEELGIEDPTMVAYVRQCGNGLLPRLINAVEQDSLQQLIIPVVTGQPEPEILFEPGTGMDNEAFRVLERDLLRCAGPAEKAGLILSRVRSLVDFFDIFTADCLFDNDYPVLFASLGNMELSMLIRIVFVDELRDNPDQFSLSTAVSSAPGSETEWVNHLIRFLPLLDEERTQAIEDLLKTETGMDV